MCLNGEDRDNFTFTIQVGAQSIWIPLSPQHNTENVNLKKKRAERIWKPWHQCWVG